MARFDFSVVSRRRKVRVWLRTYWASSPNAKMIVVADSERGTRQGSSLDTLFWATVTQSMPCASVEARK